MQSALAIGLFVLAAWCAVSAVIALYPGGADRNDAGWLGLDQWVWIYGIAATALTAAAVGLHESAFL